MTYLVQHDRDCNAIRAWPADSLAIIESNLAQSSAPLLDKQGASMPVYEPPALDDNCSPEQSRAAVLHQLIAAYPYWLAAIEVMERALISKRLTDARLAELVIEGLAEYSDRPPPFPGPSFRTTPKAQALPRSLTRERRYA